MDATSSATATAIQVAVQKLMLDALKANGSVVTSMANAAPAGSVNSPSQGTNIDALA